jgi:hypothetical protein
MNKVWSAIEEQFIRENAATMKDKDGAEALSGRVGRRISVGAWRKKRLELGIRKKCGRGVCGVVGDDETQ